jgi:hypothetical protein
VVWSWLVDEAVASLGATIDSVFESNLVSLKVRSYARSGRQNLPVVIELMSPASEACQATREADVVFMRESYGVQPGRGEIGIDLRIEGPDDDAVVLRYAERFGVGVFAVVGKLREVLA